MGLVSSSFRIATELSVGELCARLADVVGPPRHLGRRRYGGHFSVEGFRIFRHSHQQWGNHPNVMGGFHRTSEGMIVDVSVKPLLSSIVFGLPARLLLAVLVCGAAYEAVRAGVPMAVAAVCFLGAAVALAFVIGWFLQLRRRVRGAREELLRLFDGTVVARGATDIEVVGP